MSWFIRQSAPAATFSNRQAAEIRQQSPHHPQSDHLILCCEWFTASRNSKPRPLWLEIFLVFFFKYVCARIIPDAPKESKLLRLASELRDPVKPCRRLDSV